MRRAPKTRVRVRACVALTTYTRLQVLFSCNQANANWRQWTHKMISQRQMAVLIAAGDVEPVTRQVEDGTVQLVGYRAKRPLRRSDSSPACLNAATMIVAAKKANEEFSRGETATLDKYRLWPFIGDDRAVCVRPRPTAIETGHIETLLAAGRLRPFTPPTPPAPSEAKPLADRTYAQALAAAGPRLGFKIVKRTAQVA